MFEQVLRRAPTAVLEPAPFVPVDPPPRLKPGVNFGPVFQQVLHREPLAKGRFGSAFLVAALFYSGAAAFVLWAERQPRVLDRQDVEVRFVQVRPPPPPRPPPVVQASLPTAPRSPPPKAAAIADKPHTVLVQAIIAPTAIPQAKPPEEEPVQDEPLDGGGDAAEYEVPAVPGGIQHPVVDASVAAELLAAPAAAAAPAPEFDARMTHPEFISGPSPRYTEKAIEREVEGIMEVRCVVTTRGRVRDCRVVKSLPFMDRAVIEALERRVYRPATLGGHPVEVYYRFRIPLKLSD